MWRAALALIVTGGLVAAVDAGARILGPLLILLGSYAGAKALRDWWRHLDQEWFLAEIALVSMGWALLAAAFATAQYVAFSVSPDAFYVDADYARIVSPRYRVAWARDSSRMATALADLDRAGAVLHTGGPPALLPGVYRLERLILQCAAHAPPIRRERVQHHRAGGGSRRHEERLKAASS
jgi:hypothetical protein